MDEYFFKSRILNRASNISQLKSESFDLLIIGGGITGAGIALDAASRGLNVALVEKNDFAFGTSSRSTKLIHGGLRYLKQLEFGLVKEVGSERAVVHKLAPHLVVPEKMLLPLYETRGFGSLLTSIGLKLYDWLAGVKPEDQRRMLTRNQTLKQEPLLKPEDVKGGAIYAEYRTDDARLTIELIKTAAQYGACVANYSEVEDFIYQDEKITGAKVKDLISDFLFQIKAKVVVSATGPWVDELRTINHSKKGKRLHLTKGVHLVIPRTKFPVKQAIYFDVEDGRMIFAIPRGEITYVGTTDTDYQGSIDEVHTSKEDAEYLIRAVNRTFPEVNLGLEDIESSWAGLRPLIHEEGKSASELSRKDEIFESDTGLISIAGGKLTGYRKMAERVVDLVIEKYFDEVESPCQTENIPFIGSDFKNDNQVKEYLVSVAEKLQKIGLSHRAAYLVHNYGRQTDLILSHLLKSLANNNELELVKAELWFCLTHEMVVNPSDFFIRRTGLLYFNRPLLESVFNKVLEEFGVHFNWSSQKFQKEKSELEMSIKLVHNF
ncbi:MAG: glycerol-3-phosphate dehydrogenase/oxidase [Cyclobacteriaceae bacterium]|nr:glycerol-3-phosphate dehydrogenase/oxidase [Cyclobacteriaceae bacterium]